MKQRASEFYDASQQVKKNRTALRRRGKEGPPPEKAVIRGMLYVSSYQSKCSPRPPDAPATGFGQCTVTN